nr:hypothetical protein [Tanacetum cinerariifolium]
MTGPTPDPVTPLNQVVENNNQNNPPSLQDQILRHMSSLEALIKQHNERAETPIVTPIRLTFHDDRDGGKGKDGDQSLKDGGDEDLKKPYKEVLKSPFTRRILDFSAPSHRMPTNLKIYDDSIDPDDHITRPLRGGGQPRRMGDADLRERVSERFSLRRRYSKDPTKVSKIIRRSNETLPDFTKRWTKEMGYIQGIPKLMQIFAFMTNSKCPELACRLADRIPQTVTKMMQRVDDFVKSEEAYKSTELPKGEQPKRGHGTMLRGGRAARLGHGNGHQKTDNYGRRDHYQLYVPPRAQNRRYYDYHSEKGHYTNDCYHLKMQLEAALESGKLNHLVKGVRHGGNNKGRQPGNNNGRRRVINMVQEIGVCQKRKSWCSQPEAWMNVPITFPLIVADDVASRLPGRAFNPHQKCGVRGKIQGGGLFRKTMLKFTVVRASSPYNIILGRIRMRKLMAISSTVYAMVKFPTPKGIATLIARTTPVYECRWSKKGSKARRIDRSEGTERGTEKSRALIKEVEEWVKAGIIMQVKYPMWISNPVLVKKEIDLKIEVVIGFPFKCFLEDYKRYHQIQMSEDDEEKTTFYTDQGTYCYTKMPFGLKNAGATYQRLVATAFQTQLGRNLEEYVDGMVIKSKTDQGMIMYIAETFENIQKINMKLNPKNHSASERGNSWITCLEPIPLQAERALSFFESLKNITKENKEDYRWTEDAERAFQELKRLILELPMLTTPKPKEILYVYLETSRDAVSSILVADRKGKQTPICTNNEVKYEALLSGLQITRKMKVHALKAKVDLKLVACQINGEFVASSEGMEKYLTKAKEYADLFKRFSIENIPQNQNQKAGDLANRRKRSQSTPDEDEPIRHGGRSTIQKVIPFSDGPLPEGLGKLKFIIVAIDYFTKWMKAKPVAKTTSGKQPIQELVCKVEGQADEHDISIPTSQRTGRGANKSLTHSLKARLGRERVGWVDELPNILWAYWTMLKTRNYETPFSLTYGIEAVILAEIRMLTFGLAFVGLVFFSPSAGEAVVWPAEGTSLVVAPDAFSTIVANLFKLVKSCEAKSFENLGFKEVTKISVTRLSWTEVVKPEPLTLKFELILKMEDEGLKCLQVKRPVTLENLYPMDDEPMWVADRVVALTLGSAITIPETANEFAIKGNHLTLVKGNQFDGRTKTEPHKHIHEFLRICDMFKYRDTENEAEMLRNCHGHNLSKGNIIKIFYHGRNEITQEVLNVTAGGIFLYKTPNQAYQLLKDKVLLKLDWAKHKKTKPSLKKTVAFADEGSSNSDTDKIMAQMDAMTLKMDAQYKELQTHAKKTKLDLNEDDIPMSREEETKFMKTFRHNSKTYQLPQARNEHVNAVFTRSGKSYNPPVNSNVQLNASENPINFDSDDEEDEEPTPQPKTKNPKPVKETPLPKPYKPKIPYPQHLRKEKMEAQYGRFLDIICDVRINVPLIDVLAGMPNYGKFLKELISNKHKIEQISAAFLSDESSAMIQNKVPPKLEDPGSFLIP